MLDGEVPGFWRSLGLPGLFDVHVHFMPDRMQRKVWAHFDEAGPLIGTEWPIHYRLPERERIEVLRGLGLRAFSSLVYAHRPAMAEDLNEWAREFAARVPECLPSATFFPEPGVGDYVRKALDGGVRVFKAHLQVGGFDPREPVLDEVWGLLAEAAVPVIVHAGSAPVGNGFTGPGPFGEVMARHPRLPAIIAHLGAPEFDGFFALADAYESLRLDTTMAFTEFFRQPFPDALLPRLRDLGLAGRVLLGSDFPSIPYPYAEQLDALARLDLGDDWLRAVCWRNGAELFGR